MTRGIKNIPKRFIAFQFLILSLISSCTQTVNRQTVDKQKTATTELTISAAASMQDVLTDIEDLYTQQHPQVKIALNFGSSGSLENQIEQGAPIDIFISAAPKQMNDLEAKKLLLAKTRQDLVRNQMVLIVPLDNQSIVDFADLAKESTKQIALGEPTSVPAGQYAEEILTNLNIIDAVRLKSVYGKDVRQVLSYVETGNVDAGIVYRTDAESSKQVKTVAIALPQTHSPIIYPVAIIKDSNHPQAAQQMLQFLFSPKAQAIFKQYGFVSINNKQLTTEDTSFCFT
ncbi:molybdate ABC transporter substrate-binding protein [Pleurocapsa sp. FMAR1]|uniref:molybdate ABC transporter substrate-binding protein n=1 Tax=Pleurocapsa sp. FMAR1 TaxID=3040204 RepID=UPI0029C7B95C|nr:molybdate ABC transporter substrate-binding protein [Pleurocapsa sp. FMAR1]